MNECRGRLIRFRDRNWVEIVQSYEVQLGLNVGDFAHFTWKGPSSNPTDAEQTARRSLKATWQLACGATRSKFIDRYDHAIVQSIRPAETVEWDGDPNKSGLTWNIGGPISESVDINKIDIFFNTYDQYNLDIIFGYILAQDEFVKNNINDDIIYGIGSFQDNFFDIYAKTVSSSNEHFGYVKIDDVSHFCLLTLTSLFSFFAPWQKEIIRLKTDIPNSSTMRASRISAAGSRTVKAIEFFRHWSVTEAADLLENRSNSQN